MVGRRYRVFFLACSGKILGKTTNSTKVLEHLSNLPIQFNALNISRDSPLRRTHSLFWSTRTNDEGVPREGRFHALAISGKISLVAPARVARFGDDGHSVVLEDGRVLPSAAIILATGYESTWRPIFDGERVAFTW